MKGNGSGENHVPYEGEKSPPFKGVLIVGQDHKIPKNIEKQFHQKDYHKIGNGEVNLKSFKSSFNVLKNRLDQTSRIYIWAHGSATNGIHSIDIPTRNLIEEIAVYSGGKPVNVHLLACYASAAALEITALPAGSVLVTHGSPYDVTSSSINIKTILQSSQGLSNTSLLQDFVLRFPLYVKYSTTISIRKYDGTTFHFTTTPPKYMLTIDGNIQRYLEDRRKKFIKAYKQEFNAPVLTCQVPQISKEEAREWCNDNLLYSALVGDTRLSKAFENRIEAFSKHIDCKALTAAFILATRQGHERLAFALLASPKIKPNTRDTYGFTALIWSVIKGLEKLICTFLGSHKIKPNSKDNNGKTALMWAAQQEQEKSVATIVASDRVNANLKDKDGFTALMYAAIKGNKVAVSTLLHTRKVKPNIKDHKGFTAFIWAAYKGCTDVLSAMLQSDRVKTNLRDYNGYSALTWAVIQNHAAAVSVILDSKKVNVYISDNKGWTPLVWAEHLKNIRIILLIEAHILKLELASHDNNTIEQVTGLINRTPSSSPKIFDLQLSTLELSTINKLSKHVDDLDTRALSETFLQEQILQAQSEKAHLDLNSIASTSVNDKYAKAQAIEELCSAILVNRRKDSPLITRRKSLTALDVLASYSDLRLSSSAPEGLSQPASPSVVKHAFIPEFIWQSSCLSTQACSVGVGY